MKKVFLILIVCMITSCSMINSRVERTVKITDKNGSVDTVTYISRADDTPQLMLGRLIDGNIIATDIKSFSLLKERKIR